MINRRRISHIVLGIACALIVFAQHAALAHAVWHAGQQLPQQQERLGESERPYAPELSRLCAFDAALGQILGCAPPPERFAPAATTTATHAPACAYDCAAAEVLAPHSRGPPALL
jgi:hypothetical protein